MMIYDIYSMALSQIKFVEFIPSFIKLVQFTPARIYEKVEYLMICLSIFFTFCNGSKESILNKY